MPALYVGSDLCSPPGVVSRVASKLRIHDAASSASWMAVTDAPLRTVTRALVMVDEGGATVAQAEAA